MAKKNKRGNTATKKKKKLVIWGRPRAYEMVDDFEKACRKYFASMGFWQKPNITGLCLYLGISRETWHNYKEKRKDFFDTIRGAEMMIETAWVDRLGSSSSPIGAIFYLKNFKPKDWKDRAAGDSPENPVYTKQITGMKISKDKEAAK